MTPTSIPARQSSDLPREQRLLFLLRRRLASMPTARMASTIRLVWFARQAALIALVIAVVLYVLGIWSVLDNTIGLLLSDDSRATGTGILAKALPTGLIVSIRPALGALQWQLERELRRRERAGASDAPAYTQEGSRIFAGALAAFFLITVAVAFLWPN